MDGCPPAEQRSLTPGVLPLSPVLTWRNDREYVPVNRLIRRSTWRFALISHEQATDGDRSDARAAAAVMAVSGERTRP
jgi:hypothetical protein